MSAASDRVLQDETHDVAAGHDVATPAKQYESERPDDGEDDYAAHVDATKRGHGMSTPCAYQRLSELTHRPGSRQSMAASSSQQQHQQGRFSPRPDLAPDLAAWDTRTSYIAPPTASSILPPPDFRPFFTLISDPISGEHHHPTVHYIFADDEDQGAITSEALAVLDRDEDTAHQDEVEERAVLLDMEADGKTVASASSLSADWQAITAEVAQAPSWGESKQGAERGLMLKIAGKETNSRETARNTDVRDLEGLVAQFGRQLESLDEVLGKETQSEAPSVVQRVEE